MAKSVLHALLPSTNKALGLILVSRDDTTYDTDFAMYSSLFIGSPTVYMTYHSAQLCILWHCEGRQKY